MAVVLFVCLTIYCKRIKVTVSITYFLDHFILQHNLNMQYISLILFLHYTQFYKYNAHI